jgi:methionyl-tRNA formyltransferase
MKILFMGTPDYAKKILEKIVATQVMEVVGVYTQPDKPVGRKKVLTPPEVKTFALEHNINVYQPHKLRDKETVEGLLAIKCDFIVVAAYGQILPKEVLDHAPCINLHASILPQYRGASPIQQTLLHGDKQTGVTAMLMDVGLDTGAILKIKTLNVGDDEMLETLFERLTIVAADLTIDVLKNYNALVPIAQDEALATHCSKITKMDGKVLFDNAVVLYNKYRAYTPWPGIYLENGLKLKKIALETQAGSHESGKILKINSDSILVGCSLGSLRIFTLQPESKKEMDALSYIHGKRLSLESYLS